ncbi:hypothetical protein BOX15_Mlig008627g1 [Macrostomum lignano]|uniref:Uncharacterized protein n=1 Tax=Macrostomum lignano TaxID=282301 RepID=A0A267GS05_9PLAT|nr:hypothetical protein BOX15_Mlig008627g1 [Macrostomum lignano]
MLCRIYQRCHHSTQPFALLQHFANKSLPINFYNCASTSAYATTSLSSLTQSCAINRRQLSQASLTDQSSESKQLLSRQQQSKPKLHWTEEFRIRSPKVPLSRLQDEPVVAIDIESDAFNDRRIAFLLRRGILKVPLHPRMRGLGKILSYCGLFSLPYLMFCKWAGGTPLLGEMTTYAIPATVAGVCIGYLGINLALEKAYLANRIYSIALDENDPTMVYISTLPAGGWLHGQHRSYVTTIDNIVVDTENASRNWAKLSFKAGGEGLSFSLPISKRKCFVVDGRAMSAFTSAIWSSSSAASAAKLSDMRGFDQVSLPNEREIDRHLDSLMTPENASQSSEKSEESNQNKEQKSTA